MQGSTFVLVTTIRGAVLIALSIAGRIAKLHDLKTHMCTQELVLEFVCKLRYDLIDKIV